MKNILFLGLIFLFSCTSNKVPRTVQETKPQSPKIIIEGHVTESESLKNTQEAELEVPAVEQVVEAPELEKPKKEVYYAVWIDSLAYDSFRALGFLQEMEKAGMKPLLVVGTGMGCWQAMSWALDDGGNRAEWQSMKWDRFEGIVQNWKDKLSFVDSKNRFVDYMDRILSTRKLTDYSLPFDCPLISAQENSSLVSGTFLSPSNLLWQQMQMRFLNGQSKAQKNLWFSGVLAGGPSTKEFDYFSEQLSQKNKEESNPIVLWLYLRTYQSSHFVGPYQELTYLLRRSMKNRSQKTEQNSLVVPLSMATRSRASIDQVKNASQRRRFLLEGRQQAKTFLKSMGSSDGKTTLKNIIDSYK